MISLDALTVQLPGVHAAEVERWVALAWVHAEGRPGAWVFEELDVARIRLIAELRALSLDDDALPTILSLLDQLYDARRQMRAVRHAIQAAPPDARDAVLRALLVPELSP